MRARTARLLALLAGLLVLAPALARGAAQITIVNGDTPGEGFNDPTPATPVGGNTGTTVGEQRLIAFEHAAQIWEGLLDSSVEIRVRAAFDALGCTADEGALGGAFPETVVSDSPNAPLRGAWYPSALASKFEGVDVVPGSDDISARFNSNIGQTGCLEGSGWYYGLDGAHGELFDLVAVLLHEIGHGLGFLTLVDESSGSEFLNQPDIFESMILDTQTNKHWTDMTPGERAVSAINGGNVVFDGPAVRAAAPRTLGPLPVLRVEAPPSIVGDLDFGTAAFGPDVSEAAVSGQLVQAIDAADTVGPSTTDGCSAYSNAAAVAGKIALVDRGDCLFVEKAANAQAAGAVAVVIADNVSGTLSSRNGRRRSLDHDSLHQRHADGRGDAAIESRRRGLRGDRSRSAATGRRRRAEPAAALRAESHGVRLLDLALGHERVAQSPHGAEPQRGSGTRRRPDAAAPARHRLGLGHDSGDRGSRGAGGRGHGAFDADGDGPALAAAHGRRRLSRRRASRSRPTPCRRRA